MASLLVFFVFALQCMSTIAVMRRETNSWRWPAFAFGYLLALAYGASFVDPPGRGLAAASERGGWPDGTAG